MHVVVKSHSQPLQERLCSGEGTFIAYLELGWNVNVTTILRSAIIMPWGFPGLFFVCVLCIC